MEQNLSVKEMASRIVENYQNSLMSRTAYADHYGINKTTFAFFLVSEGKATEPATIRKMAQKIGIVLKPKDE
jgi:hypothetical protein